ncbi:hypothetical protein GC194_10635 [bacterium]|nr:hypothetical protein [bacterium]
MEKALKSAVLFLFIIQTNFGYAQKRRLIGLWEVQSVVVGSEEMTPVAKWTRINSDGTFQSGNGWLQNSLGTWEYNNSTKVFTAVDSFGFVDEFGGFHVSFTNGYMIWEREEDGMKVLVTLQPIQNLPIAPADYLVGMWELVDDSDARQPIINELDSLECYKLFVRWDRVFIYYGIDGNKLTGYWHINGHRPELTFLPHNNAVEPESWIIDVNSKMLIISGISKSNQSIVRKYKRVNTH